MEAEGLANVFARHRLMRDMMRAGGPQRWDWNFW